ncbi:Uncharacterised protein [Klebsiella pneumoniae]|uniref:hypothetical protein n=1 Tax=Klebsiella pneumoniae TaxID=573 RepID=UPI0009D555CA|nr:hypothetical protein [Klebsiella pneumoniae]SLS04643.1 Uncharacterised protein [Klebsiella pneumoniae]SLT33216.1 Uncharacterised protein [Klebsiella pneumoniae]SLT33922.1 Uncharacterised protein [Klebsiella pneumoniae]SLT66513.1 Uncharacterised protein [Klebsiella pneumoniae]SLT77709.1 Uncharacterised protein [Klebsiella pneumoniae]
MNIKEIGNVFHCDCGFSWHRGKNGNHNCADGLREKVRQLAAENMALKNAITDHSHSVHFCEVCGKDDPCSTDDVCYALKDIPATDRIVAGIKADGVEEREKTITFTAAKKRTQDGVALIAIGKPYKIHNDDVIGEFFIGERGRYGVITMDRLNYFATSDEYAWAFSLREGADK